MMTPDWDKDRRRQRTKCAVPAEIEDVTGLRKRQAEMKIGQPKLANIIRMQIERE